MMYDILIINYRNYSSSNLPILINYDASQKTLLTNSSSSLFLPQLTIFFLFSVWDKNFIDEKLASVTCMENENENKHKRHVYATHIHNIPFHPYLFVYFALQKFIWELLNVPPYLLPSRCSFMYTQLKFYES